MEGTGLWALSSLPPPGQKIKKKGRKNNTNKKTKIKHTAAGALIYKKERAQRGDKAAWAPAGFRRFGEAPWAGRDPHFGPCIWGRGDCGENEARGGHGWWRCRLLFFFPLLLSNILLLVSICASIPPCSPKLVKLDRHVRSLGVK